MLLSHSLVLCVRILVCRESLRLPLLMLFASNLLYVLLFVFLCISISFFSAYLFFLLDISLLSLSPCLSPFRFSFLCSHFILAFSCDYLPVFSSTHNTQCQCSNKRTRA